LAKGPVLLGIIPGGGRRILETLGFEGKYPSDKSGPCFKRVSLRIHPMPSRTIQESHRPRVSNRTMRCHSSSGQPSGLLFQKTTGAVTTAKWNHREEEAYLRFARGDENRALGLRKTSLRLRVHVQTVGLNAETKKGSVPTRRGNMSLDIPFYRTLGFEGKYPPDKSGPSFKHATPPIHPIPSPPLQENHIPLTP